MFETAFTLGLTQFARSLSFPERLHHRTARNAALEPWRLRNAGLDALYYDVKALTPDETFYISDSIASEGLIMIVPPTGGPMLTICDSVEEYRLRGGRNVHALAVAGIGGSAIGAAAFARNVADAIGEPVAAVVSGYGLGDIVNEAIGGAFLFGWLGHVRSSLEVIDDVVGRPKLGAYGDRDTETDSQRRTGLDADTVATLLLDPALSFRMIAGHSRGNRVISDALYAVKTSNPGRLETLANAARIVTFGGRIKMPEAFVEVIDVVGEFDWFGELNSRPKIATDIRVPFSGHSTNTDMPTSIGVTAILTGILADTVAAPETAFIAADTQALAEQAPEAFPEAKTEAEVEALQADDAATPTVEAQPDTQPVVEAIAEEPAPQSDTITLSEIEAQPVPAILPEEPPEPMAAAPEPAPVPPKPSPAGAGPAKNRNRRARAKA